MLFDCVHNGLVETFGIEEWDRLQRIIEIETDDFETAPEKTDDLILSDI